MSEATGFDQDTPPEPMPVLDPRMANAEGVVDEQSNVIVKPSEVIAPPADDSEEQDVDINAALSEAQEQDVDHSAKNDGAGKEETADEILDRIQPKTEPKQWTFGRDDQPLQYVQRRLSFVGKMQWFALVGSIMDKAMSGPDGVSVSELFEGPGGERVQGQTLSVDDFREADTFVRAIGKLAIHAPSFIVDSYCIWLGVPEHERPYVRQIMALPEEDGGLSDEMGVEIIEVFLDQNFDALADFFQGKVGQLRDRLSTLNEARSARSAS